MPTAGWAEDELRTFRSRVEKLQGRWIVTLDDSPFNREFFAGCRIKAVQTKNGCVNNRKLPNRHFSEIIGTSEQPLRSRLHQLLHINTDRL